MGHGNPGWSTRFFQTIDLLPCLTYSLLCSSKTSEEVPSQGETRWGWVRGSTTFNLHPQGSD